MSRFLPPHPNLDHLRKQAKELLRELKQHSAAVKLADAQHSLARDYGFASWPKLKAYVEALPHAFIAPEKANPFVGQWRANLSKSRRHPSTTFQSALLQFAVSGDVVTITDSVIDDSGREQYGQNIIVAGATKDGQVVGWGTYEVSDDGQTLTISGDQQLIVLERS